MILIKPSAGLRLDKISSPSTDFQKNKTKKKHLTTEILMFKLDPVCRGGFGIPHLPAAAL